MTQLSAIYLTMTLGVFFTCWLAYGLDRAASDVFTAATVVMLFASLSVLIRMWVPPPWSQAGNPVQDVICAALFLGAYTATRAKWALALAVMFVIQLSLHAGYWLTEDFSNHARRVYAIKVNTLYCGQLAALFIAGGGHVFRRGLYLARLPVRWRGALNPRAE